MRYKLCLLRALVSSTLHSRSLYFFLNHLDCHIESSQPEQFESSTWYRDYCGSGGDLRPTQLRYSTVEKKHRLPAERCPPPTTHLRLRLLRLGRHHGRHLARGHGARVSLRGGVGDLQLVERAVQHFEGVATHGAGWVGWNRAQKCQKHDFTIDASG